jgi:hypothetical protein
MRTHAFLTVAGLVVFAGACAHSPPPAGGPDACPAAVTQSVTSAFPGSAIQSCKPEGNQFEVKVDKAGEKVETDVTADGTIVQTETVVDLAQVPEKVLSAFAAKYPGARATKAEKQVRTGKGARYELAFRDGAKTKEATFADDGTFIEEE